MEIKKNVPKRKIRSRFVRSKENLPPIRLTSRDIEILRSLADYRLLSTYQIKRLFFRTIHKARKRLFKLWQYGFIDRRFQPVKLGQGNVPILYTLSRQGARILARHDGLSEEARYHAILDRNGSFLFIDHALAISDFRINLVKACENSLDIKLLFWKQGKSTRSSVSYFDGNLGRRLVRVSIIPDAFFGLEIDENEHYFFLEIDRGTTTIGRFLDKISAYYNLSVQKKHVGNLSIPQFRVLMATSSPIRMTNLMKSTKETLMTRGGRELFLFTTLDSCNLNCSNGALGRIWKSCDADEDLKCLIN